MHAYIARGWLDVCTSIVDEDGLMDAWMGMAGWMVGMDR